MSIHFGELAEQAAQDGVISPEEISALYLAGWADGKFDAAEADTLFMINGLVGNPTSAWTDFFVEALSEFITVNGRPRGYVTEEQADWLIARIGSDGRFDSMTELELLARVFDKSFNTPARLRAFALAEIEKAVLTGSGPTRCGGTLDPGCISAAEVRLIRRFIFAQAGDRPACVSRGEAELLFRLKDAALTATNAPAWKQLFVQGVGNYLQGFGGEEQLTNERATELDQFMNDTAHGVLIFLGKVANSAATGGLREGLREVFKPAPAPRDYDGEVAAEHKITTDEHSWLQSLIHSDGEIDDYEQALLEFLAEDLDDVPPS